MVKNKSGKKVIPPSRSDRECEGDLTQEQVVQCDTDPPTARQDGAVWVLIPSPKQRWWELDGCWMSIEQPRRCLFVTFICTTVTGDVLWGPSFTDPDSPMEKSPQQLLTNKPKCCIGKVPRATTFLLIAMWLKCCSERAFSFYCSLDLFIFFPPLLWFFSPVRNCRKNYSPSPGRSFPYLRQL